MYLARPCAILASEEVCDVTEFAALRDCPFAYPRCRLAGAGVFDAVAGRLALPVASGHAGASSARAVPRPPCAARLPARRVFAPALLGNATLSPPRMCPPVASRPVSPRPAVPGAHLRSATVSV